MDTIFEAGYEYAYFFPGMQKVIQAAGRVIRSNEDEGIVYLIDDRFAQPEVRGLLPSLVENGAAKKEGVGLVPPLSFISFCFRC